MAKYGSASISGYYADGISLLAAGPKTIAFTIEAGMEDVTALGDTSHANLPTGLSSALLEQGGALFDESTGSMHDTLSASQQTRRIVSVIVSGNTIGQAAWGCQGDYISSYKPVGTVGQITKANATHSIYGRGDWGKIIQSVTAKTADWNTKTDGTPVDSLASSAFGASGYLQVVAISGFSGFVGTIRHSADNSAYSDLIAFTNTAAVGAERKVVSGTVNRYLCFDGNVTGSGSITVLVHLTRFNLATTT